MQREESVRRRRLERSARFLDYINKHPDQFPVVERTTKGKAVPVEGKELDRLYEQGCKVIVIPDPDEPRAKYGFFFFLGAGPDSGVGVGTPADERHLWGAAIHAARLPNGVRTL
jgi:hypothetical protein